MIRGDDTVHFDQLWLNLQLICQQFWTIKPEWYSRKRFYRHIRPLLVMSEKYAIVLKQLGVIVHYTVNKKSIIMIVEEYTTTSS